MKAKLIMGYRLKGPLSEHDAQIFERVAVFGAQVSSQDLPPVGSIYYHDLPHFDGHQPVKNPLGWGAVVKQLAFIPDGVKQNLTTPLIILEDLDFTAHSDNEDTIQEQLVNLNQSLRRYYLWRENCPQAGFTRLGYLPHEMMERLWIYHPAFETGDLI